MTVPHAAQMSIETLIADARGPEDADPFAEPMFLERFAALVRAQALEEAARVCEQQHAPFDMDHNNACDLCADAIRAIAATKQQAQT